MATCIIGCANTEAQNRPIMESLKGYPNTGLQKMNEKKSLMDVGIENIYHVIRPKYSMKINLFH